MESKHTPGPWKLAPETEGVFVDNGRVTVCRLDFDMSNSGKNVSDAQLIAAAPDLLAACYFALDKLGAGRLDTRMDAREVLEAAIARAKGEEQ